MPPAGAGCDRRWSNAAIPQVEGVPPMAGNTGVGISEQDFRAAVERLRVPGMGTEVVAPMLALLIQVVRPQRVLEVGMGYTTPFLVRALAEVEDQVRAEVDGLV